MVKIFITALGIISTLVGFLVFGGKIILKDWQKKGRDLEVQRKKNTDLSIQNLSKEIDKFNFVVTNMRKSIDELKSGLAQNTSDVKLVSQRYEDFLKLIEHYERNVQGKIQNEIKTQVTNLVKQINLAKKGQS